MRASYFAQKRVFITAYDSWGTDADQVRGMVGLQTTLLLDGGERPLFSACYEQLRSIPE